MPDYSSVDNKFKFITIAAARCRQLQRGARPRVEPRSRKAVTIAQEEVLRDLIEFRVPEAVPETASVAPGEAGESEDAR